MKMVNVKVSTVYTQRNRFISKRQKKNLGSFLKIALLVSLSCWIIMVKSTIGKRHSPASRHRIAIIIPYLSANGPYLPPYMGIFLQSAAGSKDLVDFLIFHNGQLRPSLGESTIGGFFVPSNVKFIDLGSMEKMSSLLLRVLDKRLLEEDESRMKLIRIISKLLERMPYALIEYKPAFGHIFEKYIPKDIYSHWGYSDFDVMFGDLPSWITIDELEQYDIVTYSYGDQYRVYIRGQFTFHKNNDKINNIWRSCDYLSMMDHRMLKIVKEKRFALESAEGCYSYAVLNRKDIKVKYASKALTDANNKEIYNNGVILSTGQTRQKSILFTPRFHAPSGNRMAIRWFEDDQNYGRISPQWEIDTMRVVDPINMNKECMHWVPRKYRYHLCFQNIESTDNVFLIDGILFKQPFRELKVPVEVSETKALFHFQDGKRTFDSSHLHALKGDSRQHEWILDRDGVYLSMLPRKSSPFSNLRHRFDYGHIYSDMLSDDRLCLTSSKRNDHMSSHCDYSVSWQDSDIYKMISDDWLSVDSSDVTLVLSAQINTSSEFDELLKVLAHNFISWKDSPVILLIHLKGPAKGKSHVIETIRNLSQQRSLYMIGIIGYRGDSNVNSNSLLSLATIACKSRWVVSGIDAREGLVISTESSFFARRVSKLYKGSSGNAFIIPKMIVKQNGMSDSEWFKSISYTLFVERNREFQAQIDGCCGHYSDYEQSIMKRVHNTWRSLNQRYIEESISDINKVIKEVELVGNLKRLQRDIIHLFNTTNLESLLHFHSQPIVMIDTQGPSGNIDTFRVIENSIKLPDKCTKGLHLAKLALLGYNFMPLPGAFTVSSLDAAQCMQEECSRCDIDDELHELITIEKRFTAKTFLYSHFNEM